jgi:hypothetical protein
LPILATTLTILATTMSTSSQPRCPHVCGFFARAPRLPQPCKTWW